MSEIPFTPSDQWKDYPPQKTEGKAEQSATSVHPEVLIKTPQDYLKNKIRVMKLLMDEKHNGTYAHFWRAEIGQYVIGLEAMQQSGDTEGLRGEIEDEIQFELGEYARQSAILTSGEVDRKDYDELTAIITAKKLRLNVLREDNEGERQQRQQLVAEIGKANNEKNGTNYAWRLWLKEQSENRLTVLSTLRRQLPSNPPAASSNVPLGATW